MILPSFLLIWLGPKSAGVFYICWFITTPLYAIIQALSTATVSASSEETSTIGRNLYRLLLFYIVIVGLFVLTGFVLAPNLLNIFGEEFRTLGTKLLQLLFITSIPYSGLQYRITMLRLRKQYLIIALTYLVQAIAFFVLLPIILDLWGLLGIGFSFLLAQLFAIGSSLLFDMGSERQ